MIGIGIKSKIKRIAKKLFSNQLFFSFQFKTQSYNLFYHVDNKIKYVFNMKTLDDILNIYTDDEIDKIYFIMKGLFIKYNSKEKNDIITDKIQIDLNNTLYISLIDEISMYNMNYAITEIFRNKLKVNIKLLKPTTIQGSSKDFELKNFICKSQEQFWKDFHMSIEKTDYELDFRLAVYDLFVATKKNKNTNILRNNKDCEFYFVMTSYK